MSVITRTCLKGNLLMNSRRKFRSINDPAVANEMKQIKGKVVTSMFGLNPLTGHPLANTAWCIQSMLLKGILIRSICLRKCVWLQNNNCEYKFSRHTWNGTMVECLMQYLTSRVDEINLRIAFWWIKENFPSNCTLCLYVETVRVSPLPRRFCLLCFVSN